MCKEGKTYGNLEIILVDDGSPDSSGQMCEDFAEKDSRVVVIHRENGGLSTELAEAEYDSLFCNPAVLTKFALSQNIWEVLSVKDQNCHTYSGRKNSC